MRSAPRSSHSLFCCWCEPNCCVRRVAAAARGRRGHRRPFCLAPAAFALRGRADRRPPPGPRGYALHRLVFQPRGCVSTSQGVLQPSRTRPIDLPNARRAAGSAGAGAAHRLCIGRAGAGRFQPVCPALRHDARLDLRPPLAASWSSSSISKRKPSLPRTFAAIRRPKAKAKIRTRSWLRRTRTRAASPNLPPSPIPRMPASALPISKGRPAAPTARSRATARSGRRSPTSRPRRRTSRPCDPQR